MKKSLLLLLLLCSIFSFAQESIIGFSKESAEKQKELESKYESTLKTTNLDEWMQKLAARPHWVGTEFGKENVDWIVEKFKSWGYKTKIEEYQVLFPYPKVRLLEMTSPEVYKAKLEAKAVDGDPYTAQGEELLPSYNAFSTDGDVEAELVFVNYGVPKDYEELEKLGIDVKGKIVIAKYYGSWRGIKPKLAAEKGAIGCIIYSDPKDDGYYRGDVYPKGAFKNKTGVQRGSVMDMPTYPGDVLTPGYAATKNAERLDRSEAKTITKIPVLPISYEDAQPLLEALEGKNAPESWRGALPITYKIGPGPAKVHLKLDFDWKLVPAYNVIATLKGEEFPDDWILRGNHHDAWVHGANDPISGLVALMEEARAVGALAKNGNKPKRSIVYCAWDAEEPGLIGSTEWVEDHIKELQEKAVIYINTDGNGRGFLNVGGSHSLEAMVAEVAKAVEDPQTKVSVSERSLARKVLNGGENSFELYALGSGSDYTPFIQHAGIPSLNLGFGGENAGGEYHTIYDTYPHYKRFKDPKFEYGVALANTAGRITLRFANAEILPMRFQPWFKTIKDYVEEIHTNLDEMRKETKQHNHLVENNIYDLTADPTKEIIIPKKKEMVPFVDFSALQNALTNLEATIDEFSAIKLENLNDSKKEELNAILQKTEQQFITEEGLPRRPWFKHQLYAPGFYTGYGVKTLPGIREALEQRNWEEANDQMTILAKTLNDFDEYLQNAISKIES